MNRESGDGKYITIDMYFSAFLRIFSQNLRDFLLLFCYMTVCLVSQVKFVSIVSSPKTNGYFPYVVSILKFTWYHFERSAFEMLSVGRRRNRWCRT